MLKPIYLIKIIFLISFIGLVSCNKDGKSEAPKLAPIVEFSRGNNYKLFLRDVDRLDLTTRMKISWPGNENIKYSLQVTSRCDNPEDPSKSLIKNFTVNQNDEGYDIKKFLPWEFLIPHQSNSELFCDVSLRIDSNANGTHWANLKKIHLDNIEELAELGNIERHQPPGVYPLYLLNGIAVDTMKNGFLALACTEGLKIVTRTQSTSLVLADLKINMGALDMVRCRLITFAEGDGEIRYSPQFYLQSGTAKPIISFKQNLQYNGWQDKLMGELIITNPNPFRLFVDINEMNSSLGVELSTYIKLVAQSSNLLGPQISSYNIKPNEISTKAFLDLNSVTKQSNFVVVAAEDKTFIPIYINTNINCPVNANAYFWGVGVKFKNNMMLSFHRWDQEGYVSAGWTSRATWNPRVSDQYPDSIDLWYPRPKPLNLNDPNLNWEMQKGLDIKSDPWSVAGQSCL